MTSAVAATACRIAAKVWGGRWTAVDPVQARLTQLRGAIEAENISWGEIAELQDMGERGLIPEDDLLLREWAGLPEDDDAER